MDAKLAESLLKGKKFSFQEKKILFIGIVNQTIYDTFIFNNNIDLNTYLMPYELYLNNNEPFKDYLYKSRTLLSARVTRLILNNDDRDLTSLLINEHINFMNQNSTPSTDKRRKKENDSNLLDDILKQRKNNKYE
ncbi:hypothetical protein [Bacillus sp. BPN334]|uniref:hypothetical protein n=1 Tax=Bacillus sp. BPN334 TaxID=2217815 RepID=UPI0011EE1709|nr:hypothetical protein [Bacillus sp. BPN334]KAA0784604.1 hypothetical protein DN393_21400 [Bacillus sp. BPN334]